MGSTESVVVNETVENSVFEWDHPVVRRGGILSFTFKEKLQFAGGDASGQVKMHILANGDRVNDNMMSYSDEPMSKSFWNLKISKMGEQETRFLLETPSDCEPGEYVISLTNGSNKIGSKQFLMLFNPWNPHDEVYMPLEEHRQEYVLNTKTIIYQGNPRSIMSLPWSLDQFSLVAIQTLLNLIGRVDKKLRSRAADLARELTALVNNIDDDGILVGRWDGVYSAGKPPFYWTGSKAIFEKYLKEKIPVKYGQCFTFAALLCSVIRLVGIGCRVVTCFDCLHDGDDTLDMEKYYDKDYNLLSHYSKDSIWNFHCWTECYMVCRGAEKYNGWHVCDATPQEASKDGRYTLGPSPVSAVKAGDLVVGHDCRFVFGEVNGDVIYKRIVNGVIETFDTKISEIGHEISTKAVGSNTRVNITSDYKYSDGSLLDVMARKNADKASRGIFTSKKLVEIRQANNRDHILIGEDLDLLVSLTDEVKSTIQLLVKCFILQHPNIRSKEIATKSVTLESTGTRSIVFKIHSKDILNQVQSDLCSVLVEVFVVNDKKMTFHDYKISLQTPNFDICLPEQIKVCEKSRLVVLMNNPMPFKIKDVSVRLEIEFTETKHKTHFKKINAGQTIKAKFSLVPTKKGFYEVRAIIYGPTIPTFREVKSVCVV